MVVFAPALKIDLTDHLQSPLEKNEHNTWPGPEASQR